ncbi:MAG: type II toxin-antitoxin system HicB family antitoxin [Acidobacteria bacterium]|nr:type II toxin-antitoxin system HicB family antitoxin [Acidobacteriota bacterium]
MARVKTTRKKTAPRSEEYSYNVGWSEEDDAYIARVLEFPSLAAHGNSQANALREIRKVVDIVIKDLTAEGEPVPVPFGKRRYSGRLNLRMSQELHRRLALDAELQGVSLNTLINTRLAFSGQ